MMRMNSLFVARVELDCSIDLRYSFLHSCIRSFIRSFIYWLICLSVILFVY